MRIALSPLFVIFIFFCVSIIVVVVQLARRKWVSAGIVGAIAASLFIAATIMLPPSERTATVYSLILLASMIIVLVSIIAAIVQLVRREWKAAGIWGAVALGVLIAVGTTQPQGAMSGLTVLFVTSAIVTTMKLIGRKWKAAGLWGAVALGVLLAVVGVAEKRATGWGAPGPSQIKSRFAPLMPMQNSSK
jgi:hypothetical protein